MEKLIQPLCPNGHQAVKLCTKKICSDSSPICANQTCQYSSKHKRCQALDVQSTLLLFQQRYQLFTSTDEDILGGIEKVMKILEITKQEYLRNIMDRPENRSNNRLRGDALRLFTLLREGPAKEISPQLVNKVVEELEDEQKGKEEVQQMRKKAADIVKRLKQRVEQSVEEVRIMWGEYQIKEKKKIVETTQLPIKKEQKIVQTTQLPTSKEQKIVIKSGDNFSGYRFSAEMCKTGAQVSNNGLTVKYGGYSGFCLVSPAVEDVSSITFKVVKNIGQVCLGLCHIKEIKESGYGWSKDYRGIYVIAGSDGHVRNILDSSQHQKKHSFFRFSSGDVVQMDYKFNSGGFFSSSSSTLKVTNRTNKMQHTLKNIKRDSSNPLYFCVFLYNKDDEVMIVK